MILCGSFKTFLDLYWVLCKWNAHEVCLFGDFLEFWFNYNFRTILLSVEKNVFLHIYLLFIHLYAKTGTREWKVRCDSQYIKDSGAEGPCSHYSYLNYGPMSCKNMANFRGNLPHTPRLRPILHVQDLLQMRNQNLLSCCRWMYNVVAEMQYVSWITLVSTPKICTFWYISFATQQSLAFYELFNCSSSFDKLPNSKRCVLRW